MAECFGTGKKPKLERGTSIPNGASSANDDGKTSPSNKAKCHQTPNSQRQISPPGNSRDAIVYLRSEDGRSQICTGLSEREYHDYRQLREKYTKEPAYRSTDPLPDIAAFYRLQGYRMRLQHCLEDSPELSKLRAEGLERWIGVSLADPPTLKFAHLQSLLEDITRMLRTALQTAEKRRRERGGEGRRSVGTKA